MGKRTQTRREALAVEAIDPKDGKRISLMFSWEKLHSLGKRSEGQIKEAARTVPMVLQKPTAIFQGLRRETDEPKTPGSEGWRCYCGVANTFREDGTPCPPWPNQVLMVFVNTDGTVFNWYWHECDPADPDLPEGHAERFLERIL